MREFGIGVIGMGWMGETHSRAFRALNERFHDSGLKARLVMCADVDAGRAETAQARFGFASSTTHWEEVIRHPEVDIVTVASPNFLHREIVRAVAQAGRHVLCEKPVGRNAAETMAIAQAARRAGINSCVGFNYRWVPMVQYARQTRDSGALGSLTHYRGRFFSSYGHNPLSQLSWRFEDDKSGFGTLGDLLSHVIDMALFLAGPIDRVTGLRHTFIQERPLPQPGVGTHFSLGREEDPSGPVTNEDYVAVLVEWAAGGRGVLEGCRVMYGPKCDLAFDLHGTDGALRWNFERMNELEVYHPSSKRETGLKADLHDGYARLVAGPEHPGHGQFLPGGGMALGYDDLKTLEAFRFLESIDANRPHAPGLEEALRVAEVQDAIVRSWETGQWASVAPLTAAE